MLVDWTDSWMARGVKEPDGFVGWPVQDPDGPGSGLYAASLLGEAMPLRPVVLLSDVSWLRLMKSRMKGREGGRCLVWNYWEPPGPWDYKPDGTTKHWIGVHPKRGYYRIDASAIVAAFEHGIVFQREDIDRLIATNRDFMWNQDIREARFQRIDGGDPDPRWKNSPGVLCTALIPYDEALR